MSLMAPETNNKINQHHHLHHHFEAKYTHLYLTKTAQEKLKQHSYTPEHIERIARLIREGKI